MSKNDVSTTDIDREGIGMLYASGIGVAIGASISYYIEPAIGWVIGSIIVGIGLFTKVINGY